MARTTTDHALPTVHLFSIGRRWVATSGSGATIDHGIYPYIEVVGEYNIALKVLQRLIKFHANEYVWRTELAATEFGLYVARGVEPENFLAKVQAHLFIVYSGDDLGRLVYLNFDELKAEVTMLFPGDKQERISAMVRNITITILQDEVLSAAKAVFNAHNGQLKTYSMSEVDNYYNVASEAIGRLRFSGYQGADFPQFMERAQTLLDEIKLLRTVIQGFCGRLDELAGEARILSSTAEKEACRAAESDDARYLLAYLGRLNSLVNQAKELVLGSKDIANAIDEPLQQIREKLMELNQIVPPVKPKAN